MIYYIEENDFSDLDSYTRIYDCIDEKSPYIIIAHSNDRLREGYHRSDSITFYYVSYITKDLFVNKTLIHTTSKEELKILMDLNGYKMTDKVVVYYSGTKKIHLEMFKLENN